MLNVSKAVLSLLVVVAVNPSPAFAGPATSIKNLIPPVVLAGGEGRNGPETSGRSIPVGSVRGTRVSDLDAAVKTCLITGDGKKGITSFLQKIHKVIYNTDARYVSPSNSTNVQFHNYHPTEPSKIDLFGSKSVLKALVPGVAIGQLFKFIPPEQGGSLACLSTENVICSVGAGGAGSGQFGIYLRRKVGSVTRDYQLRSEETFPVIVTEKMSTLFDDLGNIVEEDRMAYGVSILVPDGETLTFYNATTKQEKVLIISTTSYIECLQAQIQELGK